MGKAGSFVLGVDGGNTKTIALVARPDGTIVGVGRAGCSDMYAAGEGPALDAIESAVRAALQHADVAAEEIVAGAFSLAGADWPEDYVFLRDSLLARGLARRATVMNDGMGALWAGSRDGTGVAVVCGTGLAVGSRAPDGRWWHGSFWLEWSGARAIASDTMHAICRAALGIDPPTALTGAALHHYGYADTGELLHAMSRRGGPKPIPDALAPITLRVAAAGDAAALHVVERHAIRMSEYALAAVREVGLAGSDFPLILTGGTMRAEGRLLAEGIAARVREVEPGAHPMASEFEPAAGTIFIALHEAGYPVDDARRSRVRETMPGHHLFDTLHRPVTPNVSE